MKIRVPRLLTRSRPICFEAGPGDAAAIAAIHNASFRQGWSEDEVRLLLIDSAVIAHRAMAGTTMIGFILSRRAAGEAEILSVAVAPARRGRGLSRPLLEMHLRRLAGLGVQAVFLEVGERNAVARTLYRNAGFYQIGRREAYYRGDDGGGTAALVLRRDLG